MPATDIRQHGEALNLLLALFGSFKDHKVGIKVDAGMQQEVRVSRMSAERIPKGMKYFFITSHTSSLSAYMATFLKGRRVENK